jgi:competence protein ComGC
MNTAPGHLKRQRGIALVETMICLPVLLLLMLAAGEVTNAFLQHNTLTKGARDGARYAAGKVINHSVKLFDLNAQLVEETKSLVVYGNTTRTGSPILPNLTVDDVTVSSLGGDVLEVRAAYAYTGITGGSLPAFGFGSDQSLGVNLQASVRMRGL